MQSLVLWLVAVACACDPCLASTSGPQRPRNIVLALVRLAKQSRPPPPPGPGLPPLPESAFPDRPSSSRLYRRRHVAPGVAPAPLGAAAVVPHRQQQQLQEEEEEGPLQEHRRHRLPEEEEREVEGRRRAWSKRGQASDDAPVSGGAPSGEMEEEEEKEEEEGEEREHEEGEEEEAMAAGLQKVGASMATNFLRHARSGPRPYDVPRIDCPAAEDQMERFPCPSPDRMGRYRCIDDHVLCDGFIDCPDGEDEDREQCMFYKTTKAHLDVLADAIIRWARGGK